MIRVQQVTPLDHRRVRVTFTNGETRDIDLTPYLHGPIFQSIAQDDQEFRKVFVHPEFHTLAWPNGADICPDVLYKNLNPSWMEEHTPTT